MKSVIFSISSTTKKVFGSALDSIVETSFHQCREFTSMASTLEVITNGLVLKSTRSLGINELEALSDCGDLRIRLQHFSKFQEREHCQTCRASGKLLCTKCNGKKVGLLYLLLLITFDYFRKLLQTSSPSSSALYATRMGLSTVKTALLCVKSLIQQLCNNNKQLLCIFIQWYLLYSWYDSLYREVSSKKRYPFKSEAFWVSHKGDNYGKEL